MLRNENPHFDSKHYDHCRSMLPESHPMNTPAALTQLQQAHLPALMWLLDANRYRAQGRSTLVAHALIRLAMQGERVNVDDISETLNGPRGEGRFRNRQHFVHILADVIRRDYQGHRFDLSVDRYTLEYRGRHPA